MSLNFPPSVAPINANINPEASKIASTQQPSQMPPDNSSAAKPDRSRKLKGDRAYDDRAYHNKNKHTSRAYDDRDFQSNKSLNNQTYTSKHKQDYTLNVQNRGKTNSDIETTIRSSHLTQKNVDDYDTPSDYEDNSDYDSDTGGAQLSQQPRHTD